MKAPNSKEHDPAMRSSKLVKTTMGKREKGGIARGEKNNRYWV
jgi:hypothetical protein